MFIIHKKIFVFNSTFKRFDIVSRSLYKSQGLMMLEDVKRSDLPKKPLIPPAWVMKKMEWEDPPPPEMNREVIALG